MRTETELFVSTGVNIPKHKKLLFLNKFKKILHDCYRIDPTFGPPSKTNSCEVRFRYLNENIPPNILKNKMTAKEFLVKYLPVILDDYEPSSAKKSKLSTPEVIVIDGEDHDVHNNIRQAAIKVIDLTSNGAEQREPEVIVLDESTVLLDSSFEQKENRFSKNTLQQATPLRRSSRKISSTESNDIQITVVRNNSKNSKLRKTPFKFSSNNDVIVVETSSVEPNCLNTSLPRFKCKKAKKRSFSQTLQSSDPQGVQTGRAGGKAKRKKMDMSIPSTNNRFSPRLKSLPGGVINYYSKIKKAIDKNKGNQRAPATRQQFVVNKKRVVTPQKIHRPSTITSRKRKSSLQSPARQSPGSFLKNMHPKQHRTKPNSLNRGSIVSTYNPNPVVVDVEGRRPIAIDANNVARGHGQGDFSTRGLNICVDYFLQRGYKREQLKVVMPTRDKRHFTPEALKEIEKKCHMVYTSSRYVDGRMVVPYDDRFIVDYAEEFGAIIVSNDRYRDLIKENPKLEHGIQRRLLNFTWIDDFLMFPKDPLGKNGPFLDQFLRF